jgi:hypothetical protein
MTRVFSSRPVSSSQEMPTFEVRTCKSCSFNKIAIIACYDFVGKIKNNYKVYIFIIVSKLISNYATAYL